MGAGETDPMDVPWARCGTGRLDGAVWRPGDPVKHLGPPAHIREHQSAAYLRSQLFFTRCGLGARDGDWRVAEWHEDDDCWCPGCLAQAGIAYELWTDDD